MAWVVQKMSNTIHGIYKSLSSGYKHNLSTQLYSDLSNGYQQFYSPFKQLRPDLLHVPFLVQHTVWVYYFFQFFSVPLDRTLVNHKVNLLAPPPPTPPSLSQSIQIQTEAKPLDLPYFSGIRSPNKPRSLNPPITSSEILAFLSMSAESTVVKIYTQYTVLAYRIQT